MIGPSDGEQSVLPLWDLALWGINFHVEVNSGRSKDVFTLYRLFYSIGFDSFFDWIRLPRVVL